MIIAQIIELDAFFLKDLLWVPPESPLNIYRLFIWWFLGIVAVRDFYHFIDNPDVKRCDGCAVNMAVMLSGHACGVVCSFGSSAWIAVGAAVVEFVIVFKFAIMKYSDMIMPDWVKVFWAVTVTAFVIVTGWWFIVGRHAYAEQVKAAKQE